MLKWAKRKSHPAWVDMVWDTPTKGEEDLFSFVKKTILSLLIPYFNSRKGDYIHG